MAPIRTSRNTGIRSAVAPLLACGLLAGCPGPLPAPPQRSIDSQDAGANVTVEPEATLVEAPSVLRLRVQLPPGVVELPEHARLFSGALSSYHLGRLREYELPATLVEREVPVVSWVEAAGRQLVVAPSLPLVPGETYSLASPSLGLIAVVLVSTDDRTPLLRRVWPPKGVGKGVERAIFCGESVEEAQAGIEVVRLDPLAVPAEVGQDLGDAPPIEGCLQLRALEQLPNDVLLVPPLRAGGLALEPAPFAVAPLPSLDSRECPPDESQLGPSCALVEDDRLILRGLEVATFWMLETPGRPLEALPVDADQRVLVRNLVPESAIELSITVLDAAGRATGARAVVNTRPVQPHVVINEVLADAVGPEPAQEWVELVNDGQAPVDLDRWTLEDIGGSVALPAHRLEPGAFALLVSEDYAEPAWDVAPPPGTTVLRLTSLGRSGLANSGEPLLLRAPEGSIISRFPGTPKPKPGVSVARVTPWALDDDPASFALHAAPGASPGAPNAGIAE